jgi:hypothetical protein
VSNPKLDGNAQAINEGLILSYIVGGSEEVSDHVAHVNFKGQMKRKPAPALIFINDPSKYMVHSST